MPIALETPSATTPLRRQVHRSAFVGGVLIVSLLVLVAVSLAVGGAGVGLDAVMGWLSGDSGTDASLAQVIIGTVRLPRTLAAVLVGAVLGLTGSATQAVFRNPLAEPGLVGISGGASLGAVVFIVAGHALLGADASPWLLPLFAFGGGLLVAVLVFGVSATGFGTSVHTLLLAGVAANALTGAAVGFFVFIATDAQVRSIMFWTLGSLSGATWPTLLVITVFTLPCAALLLTRGRALNLLLLGEAEASHLGINVERLKRSTLACIVLAVSACVSFVGIIGFVGLVVPHIVRLVLGPDHRRLLVPSALFGSCVLLGADVVSRTVALPAELPIGVVTAALGAPFFLWLLRRAAKNG